MQKQHLQDESFRTKISKVASQAKRLELTVLSSATLEKGQRIVIGPQGLEGENSSSRDGGQLDGVTYFGRKKSIKKVVNDPSQIETTTSKEIVNDFIIPSKNPQTAEQQRGRHFQVRFDPDTLKYYIKDLGIGHGVFAKLDAPSILKDNMILNVGEAHIVVNIHSKDDSEDVGAGITGEDDA